MALKISCLLFLTTLMHSVASMASEIKEEFTDDYCLTETFQPRCLKNEAILMKSATYGRMRIGRCITAEEVEMIGSRHLGCSADVLALIDRKCSGKMECNVPIIHISAENSKPCIPGLTVYLEAAYSCISVADEKRSCVVDVSTTPIHIIASKTCGTKSQPWIVEAPVGQKISISLIIFPTLNSTHTRRNISQSCRNNYGSIVDKAGKRNVTICAADNNHRENKLYSSSGNAIEIFLNSSEQGGSNDDRNVILSLQAVGCSDIIPPEDAYLKRNGDAVVVGCYTSRKSWHLNCESGNWIGVIGNCSQVLDTGILVLESDADSELQITTVNNNQALIIVGLAGFTVAICLAIICFGAIWYRRSNFKKKMKQEYKTLNYPINSTVDRGIHPNNIATDYHGNELRGMVAQPMPTYSVFVGDDAELYNGVNNSVTVNNTNPL